MDSAVPINRQAAPAPTGEQLLAWRRHQLSFGGHAADLDWLLDLGAGLGWQGLQRLRLHPQRPLALGRSLGELEALWQQHRQTQIPLQYLLGRCPWRDLELQVGPGVLIPRPETELLVELAFQGIPAQPSARLPLLWADLGTGSAAMAIAMAMAWPESRGLAVELSPEARTMALSNLNSAKLLQRVQLLAGSWWTPLKPWWGRLELVVANPPYIPTAVWAELEPAVRNHEPSLALDGGPDGLRAIAEIAAGALAAIAPGGVLLIEHHHDQAAAVLDLLDQAGLVQLETHADLEGRGRFARGLVPRSRGFDA